MMLSVLRASLLAGVLGLGTFSAAAQSESSADSVQAVRELFRRHRTGGWIWTGVGGAFALRIASVAATSNSSGSFSSTTGGTVVGVGLLGGVPAGIGISKLVRFSKAREEEVLVSYSQGKPLPENIRRRLKRKHFKI